MIYYSMQVIWPQESQLLFVPANNIVLRGVYANLTAFSTWRKSFLERCSEVRHNANGRCSKRSERALICAHLHHERLQIIFFLCVQTFCVQTFLRWIAVHRGSRRKRESNCSCFHTVLRGQPAALHAVLHDRSGPREAVRPVRHDSITMPFLDRR